MRRKRPTNRPPSFAVERALNAKHIAVRTAVRAMKNIESPSTPSVYSTQRPVNQLAVSVNRYSSSSAPTLVNLIQKLKAINAVSALATAPTIWGLNPRFSEIRVKQSSQKPAKGTSAHKESTGSWWDLNPQPLNSQPSALPLSHSRLHLLVQLCCVTYV